MTTNIRILFLSILLSSCLVPILVSADYTISVSPSAAAPGEVIEITVSNYIGSPDFLEPVKIEDESNHIVFYLIPLWDDSTSLPSPWVQSGSDWKRLFRVYPAAIYGRNIIYIGSNRDVYAAFTVLGKSVDIEPEKKASLTCTPEEGPSGMNLGIEGIGFPQNKEIIIQWDQPIKQHTPFQTDTGTFSTTIIVPSGSYIGEHTVGAIVDGVTEASDTVTVLMYLRCRLGYPLTQGEKLTENQVLSSGQNIFLWDPYHTGSVKKATGFYLDEIDLRIPGPGPLVFEFNKDSITALTGLQ